MVLAWGIGGEDVPDGIIICGEEEGCKVIVVPIRAVELLEVA